jgi:type I restriction enzyme S subunit
LSEISKLLFSRTDLLENKITISEIGVLKNGYAFQSSSYNADGSYQILTISNVTGERYICSEGCNRVFAKPSDIQPHQELMTDDILISLTGNVGRVSLCKEGMYLLNQRVGLLQLNTGVNREYVYQAISTRRFEQSMISCGQGAAQMNIGKRDVEGYLIPYTNNPTNLYQISSILKSYDELIFIESRRLQLLYSQKRYFLVQMFI